jgi:ATP-dependent RNA helicase SUPV3L1/SUV3
MTGERPAGAAPDGRGFVVTPAMTSLLGSSGEDLAVILKGLGYRMERRPKPAEPPPAPSIASVEPGAETAASKAAAEEGSDVPRPDAPPLEEPPVEEPTVEPPDPPPPEAPPPSEAPPQEQPPEVPVEEPPVESPPAQTAASQPEGTGAPETIEVWRPSLGRPRREERKPRAAAGPRPGKQARDRRDGERRFDGPRPGEGEGRGRRAERERERPRPPRVERQPRQRERPVDPDSPFAALAALKLSLEKSNRE